MRTEGTQKRSFFAPLLLLLCLLLEQQSVLAEDPYAYCWAPGPQAHEFPVAGYTLAHISIVVRHGDRTPVNLMAVGEDKYTWECQNTETVTESSIGSALHHTIHNTLASNAFSPYLWHGTCAVGQLTERGIEQHLTLGRALMKVYGTAHGLLPAVLDSPDKVYVRATDYPRTRQSAISLLAGAWDAAHRTAETRQLRMEVYPSVVETLVESGDSCPRVKKLMEAQKSTPEWKAHLKNVSKALTRMNAITGHNLDGVFKHSDVLHTRLCHNKSLPCRDGQCVSQADLQAVHDGANFEMIHQYATDEIARLGIGIFVQELRDRIVAAGTAKRPLLALYGAHDFTHALLIQALHLGVESWPPYASHMVFELWQPSTRAAPAAVRLVYNGDVMRVPGCTVAGGTACSLAELDTIIKQRLTIQNYTKECL